MQSIIAACTLVYATDRQTDRQTDKQTDNVVIVDPSLNTESCRPHCERSSHLYATLARNLTDSLVVNVHVVYARRPDMLETEMETRLKPPAASGAQQGSSLFTHFEDVQVSI